MGVERKKPNSSGIAGLGTKIVYNPFHRSYEVPFPTVPPSIRQAAVQKTGRTIEESYEDFLHSLLTPESEYLAFIERLKNG